MVFSERSIKSMRWNLAFRKIFSIIILLKFSLLIHQKNMFKFLCFASLFFFISCSSISHKNIQEHTKDFLIFEAKNGFSLDFYKDLTTAKFLQEKNGGVILNGSYF